MDPSYPLEGMPPLSHLVFADDLLLFSGADTRNARCIANILQNFAVRSGLKCNLDKSAILGSTAVEDEAKVGIAAELGIQFVTNFESYLGFPILHGRAKVSHFEFLVEKLHNKFGGWK